VRLKCFNTKCKIKNSGKIQHGYLLQNVDHSAHMLAKAEYVAGHLVAYVSDEE
jgi:hypothetical protein